MPCDDPVRVEVFAAFDALPAEMPDLLDQTLFANPAWWRCVQAEARPVRQTPCFALCRIGGRPAALLPLWRSARGALSSLTTPYSCLYSVWLASDLTQMKRTAALRALMLFCGSSAVTRLEALDADAASTGLLIQGAKQAGLYVLRFAHFGNWHEDVAGLGWAAYLARRPGALRETIRRRLRQADRHPDAALTIIEGLDGLEAGIAAYETVFGRSWKQPEPYPRFNATLMRALAPSGSLRLGVWAVAGRPIAVQFWVVEGGRATVLKLAHDETFKALSPGTVLTALMLRRFLDQEHVTKIDFGRGDDGYKQGWTAERRQRIGLLLINPWRPAGWVELARHGLGRLRSLVRAVGEQDSN
jgi:hypothetical protein